MTVICTNGKVIAGDSRIVSNSSIVTDDFEKVFVLPDGSACGIAGDIVSATQLRIWLEGGMDPENKPKIHKDDSAEAVILRPGGAVLYIDERCATVPYPAPFAIGVGGQAALVAMSMGADPVRACLEACRVNCGCGGRIRSAGPGKPATKRTR